MTTLVVLLVLQTFTLMTRPTYAEEAYVTWNAVAGAAVYRVCVGLLSGECRHAFDQVGTTFVYRTRYFGWRHYFTVSARATDGTELARSEELSDQVGYYHDRDGAWIEFPPLDAPTIDPTLPRPRGLRIGGQP